MTWMKEDQYDTLLNGILSLGTGQRRLTRLMLELAQASSEQEERLEQAISFASGEKHRRPLNNV